MRRLHTPVTGLRAFGATVAAMAARRQKRPPLSRACRAIPRALKERGARAAVTLDVTRKGLLLAIGMAVLALWPAAALAQDLPAYTAKAGMLNIGADPERPEAEIFHVAYTAVGADPATRPVTFVWNGGPGGASIFLHLSAIGPKIIVSAGDGSFPAAPARLETNPDSWISFTDLVFIDPVGTGYSRTLPGPDGALRDPKPFYTTMGDLDSIAQFIRQWLTVNKRWGSPKAIAGESYGGMRVAALTRILAEGYSINLNRAVMISPELNVNASFDSYSLMFPMTQIPTQAAIASVHGKGGFGTDDAAMMAAEDYALNAYLTGLATLGRMTPEQQTAFYARVSEAIGIDPALLVRHNGRIDQLVYAGSLLADKGLVLDRYDGSQASDNPKPQDPGIGVLDRSLTVMTGILLSPFMDYVRTDLGYATDRDYVPLSLLVNAAFDRTSTVGTPEDVGIALAQNTDLKVLVVHGTFDTVTPYFMSRFVLEQATRAKGARQRLYFGTYPGGHMFYLRKASRAEFAADVRGFFETPP
jgi:carboxypeptidase C (cathepsin A)